MEVVTGCSHFSEKKPALESCPSVDEGKMGQEKKDLSANAFVNHGNIPFLNDSYQIQNL